MNKSRRSKLADARMHMDVARSIVQGVIEEEQTSLDGLPDNLRDSERAEKMEAAIDAMDEAIESIVEASSSLEKAAE